MNLTLSIFISSKMQELAAERQAIRDLLPTLGGDLLQLSAWVYESDAPASDDTIRQVYLDALEQSALYIGLFWNQYGEWTVDEFNRATEWGIPRHIYVKSVDDHRRDSRLVEFLDSQNSMTDGIAARWFTTIEELCLAVRESLGVWISKQLQRHRMNIPRKLGLFELLYITAPIPVAANRDMGTVNLLLQGKMEDFDKDQLIEAVSKTLGLERSNVSILQVWSGSIWVRIQLPLRAAERLYDRYRGPYLAQHGALSAILYQDSSHILDAPDQLIGRDDLLATITPQIEQNQHILLHGFGGEGKTALAATLAQQHLDADCGPVLWLQVGNLDADAIFEALVVPLNAQQAITERSGDAKLIAVQQVLAATSVSLIVLDDVRNGQALFQVLRAMPLEVAVVITSRSRYPFPVMHNIEGLGVDYARELISHYAGQDMSHATEVNELAADLGYHAYGLEIAARTMLADQLSPADLRARIADTPHNLTMPDFFAEAGRESVSALLQTSLIMLDPEARATFTAFGAFTSPVLTIELLELYLGHDPARNLYNLDTLVRRGLVKRIPGDERNIVSVRIHDLAHSYARVTTTDEERVRALRVCLEYIRRYNAPSMDNFKALRPVLPVLLGESEAAVELGRDADVEQFAWDLYVGSRILFLDGHNARALPLLHQAAAAAARQGHREHQGTHLGNLGVAFAALGEMARAIEYFEQALVIAQETGDQLREAQRLGNLGNAYRNLGEFAQAIDYFEQALVIAREIGDRNNEGAYLGSLGTVYRNRGEIARAIDYFEQALTIAQEIGDRRGEGAWFGNLGNAYKNLGQATHAIEMYERALAIAREIGDRSNEGSNIGNLGSTYADLGETTHAIEMYERALAIAREIGNRSSESTHLGNLGSIFAELGETAHAIEMYERALVIAQEIRDRQSEDVALGNLGSAYLDLGEVARAIEYYEQALVIAREIGDRNNEGAWLGNLGSAYQNLGEVARAIEYYEQAHALFTAIGAAPLIDQIERLLADARAQLANDDSEE